MTERYQTRLGHALNDGGEGGKGCGLPFSEKTTADRLKAMGYAT